VRLARLAAGSRASCSRPRTARAEWPPSKSSRPRSRSRTRCAAWRRPPHRADLKLAGSEKSARTDRNCGRRLRYPV